MTPRGLRLRSIIRHAVAWAFVAALFAGTALCGTWVGWAA